MQWDSSEETVSQPVMKDILQPQQDRAAARRQ